MSDRPASTDHGLANTPALQLLRDTQSALLRAQTDKPETAFDLADAIGGNALEAEQPARLRADFLSEVLARIDQFETSNARAQEAARAAGLALEELLGLPQPLRDVSLRAAGEGGWHFSGPGVKSMKLMQSGPLKATLLRIEPGHGAPTHDHTGAEYTLVVKGAFHDGKGRYGPGDLSVKRPGQIHHPIAEPGAVCFALAVEEGDIALTGALGVLQRLFTRH